MKEDVHVINCGGYWTVINKNYYASRNNHSHFNKRKAAYTLKTLIGNKIIPKSPYMIESALRVSIDREYKRCIKREYDIPFYLNGFSDNIEVVIKSALLKRRKDE